MSRPSSYSQEVADLICDRLIEGKSLRAICREDPEMPAPSTICRWLAQIESFREQYARAREAQADTLADEILDIADDVAHDTVSTEAGDRANSEWINRSRLRVDARKWLAGKMAPKKYGDKIQSEVTGANGAPFAVQIVRFGDSNDDDPVA